MSNTHLAMSADGGPDDLPRTLRREREAREREAREREARERGGSLGAGAPVTHYQAESHVHDWHDEAQPTVVTAFKVPFFRLMLFFIKAVFAAVPALIILGALLWGGGYVLKSYMPWLVQMEVVIKVPR